MLNTYILLEISTLTPYILKFGAVVLILILAICLVKAIPSKGQVGEKSMDSRLERLPKEYIVLNDVIISAFGNPTQIDHIVLSPYAIFVIETKNYKGKIYGDEEAQYWTQDIYGKKYKQYNPILQNRTHISILQKMLNFTNIGIYPISPF
ncbi:MAG TPA: nuclease-related domain-containing protein [Paludibacteraceae bacterium]|nr:nuclease-related domain-containing protein [Paludibacteraceae bacterium]HQF49509.1 nuclease-related domain-containing protein [Paludibacteraceae bacterium]HQJ89674.1 nuclease-related domain-containing protein [Paludibacteraceae bacterium]